jgi:hypothetical protein
VASRKSPATRAKDTDRNDTCQVLDSALADGQLSMEEHRTRVATATGASTLGQLQSLVSDLQNDNAPVQLPDLKEPSRIRSSGGGKARARGFGAAFAAVFILLGIGIGWGLYGNSSSPFDFTTDPGAKADGVSPIVLTAPDQLQSLGGLSGLFEQMKQRFGDTRGYSMYISADRAYLDRPDPRDDRRVLSYNYRGGWGDPSSSTRSEDDRVVDLAQFDHAKIIGLLRGAPDTLKMGSQNITDTRIDIDPSDDPLTPDAVTIRISVTGEFDSGYLYVGPDGTIRDFSPAS